MKAIGDAMSSSVGGTLTGTTVSERVSGAELTPFSSVTVTVIVRGAADGRSLLFVKRTAASIVSYSMKPCLPAIVLIVSVPLAGSHVSSKFTPIGSGIRMSPPLW